MFLSGGSNPKPGEISLAHNGVLFLDELTEFSRAALEQLREPLETGSVHIARANRSVSYPAAFQLIAACNPCPCGYLGDGTDRCRCSVARIEHYRAKLSGPLLDRIDIHLHLPRVSPADMRAAPMGETSAAIAERVAQNQQIQFDRQACLNYQLSGTQLETVCELSQENHAFLDGVCEKLNLSARAYHRILRLARTLADMSQAALVQHSHLAEAVSFRALDRKQ